MDFSFSVFFSIKERLSLYSLKHKSSLLTLFGEERRPDTKEQRKSSPSVLSLTKNKRPIVIHLIK